MELDTRTSSSSLRSRFAGRACGCMASTPRRAHSAAARATGSGPAAVMPPVRSSGAHRPAARRVRGARPGPLWAHGGTTCRKVAVAEPPIASRYWGPGRSSVRRAGCHCGRASNLRDPATPEKNAALDIPGSASSLWSIANRGIRRLWERQDCPEVCHGVGLSDLYEHHTVETLHNDFAAVTTYCMAAHEPEIGSSAPACMKQVCRLLGRLNRR